MRFSVVPAILAVLGSGSAIHAQDDVADGSAVASAPYHREIDDAARRGREMYRYDQAAWRASDRMALDWGNQPTTQLRGYLVLPGEAGQLLAVFYGEENGKTVEFARYEVEGSEVVGGGPIGEGSRPELSPLAARMVAARDTAFGEARKQAYGLCSNSRPNTLVLPPDANDVVSVYLLTAPSSNSAYPIGGHYRVDVDADGAIVGSRRFLNSCFVADFSDAARATVGGGNRVAIVISHLLDPQPTEIHAFASYYVTIPMMIATTQNELMWSVERGSISYAGTLDEFGRRGA